MPKPRPPRQVPHEALLARRIQERREALGWKLDGLAQRMTEAGCPMDKSAIYRIESGKPPRRITFDEAMTFAQVFGTDIVELTLPIAITKSRQARKLFQRYLDRSAEHDAIGKELIDLRKALVAIAEDGFEQEVLDAIDASSGAPLPSTHQLQFWRLVEEVAAHPERFPDVDEEATDDGVDQEEA